MKFRYYIADTFDGSIKGTDSAKVAKSAASSEDNFVIDTEDGTWRHVNGDVEHIHQQQDRTVDGEE